MMMPRSYHHGSPPRSPPKSRSSSEDRNKKKTQLSKSKSNPRKSDSPPSKPHRLLSVTAATPSKPVIIPTRSQTSKSRRQARQSRSSSDEKLESREKANYNHDPNAIPPSMAALLAISSIPQPRRSGVRSKGFGRRTEIENLSAEQYRYSLSSTSPKSWSILQSPPDTESDVEASSVEAETDHSSLTSRSTVAPMSSYRSLSCDSMQSLEMDFETESAGSLSPPDLSNRYKPRPLRGKLPSPAVALANDADHPLSFTNYPDTDDSTPALSPISEVESDSYFVSMDGLPASTFKSNLTASLRMLKAAARNLGAPSRHQDPFAVSPAVLAAAQRSTSSPVNPESVVKPSTLVEPTKAQPPQQETKLRPPHLSGNIDALPFYLATQLSEPVLKASIQLQTYLTSPLSTPSATAPPIFAPAANPPVPTLSEDLTNRERQQRENSNFLRVVVLEMNMRRAGKLNGDGRARVWLGARSERAIDQDVRSETGQGIADGGKGSGAVVLDGEIEEARQIGDENDEERDGRPGKTKTKISRGRSDRSIPTRWLGAAP